MVTVKHFKITSQWLTDASRQPWRVHSHHRDSYQESYKSKARVIKLQKDESPSDLAFTTTIKLARLSFKGKSHILVVFYIDLFAYVL